jgi:hypothetical protein
MTGLKPMRQGPSHYGRVHKFPAPHLTLTPFTNLNVRLAPTCTGGITEGRVPVGYCEDVVGGCPTQRLREHPSADIPEAVDWRTRQSIQFSPGNSTPATSNAHKNTIWVKFRCGLSQMLQAPRTTAGDVQAKSSCALESDNRLAR